MAIVAEVAGRHCYDGSTRGKRHSVTSLFPAFATRGNVVRSVCRRRVGEPRFGAEQVVAQGNPGGNRRAGAIVERQGRVRQRASAGRAAFDVELVGRAAGQNDPEPILIATDID